MNNGLSKDAQKAKFQNLRKFPLHICMCFRSPEGELQKENNMHRKFKRDHRHRWSMRDWVVHLNTLKLLLPLYRDIVMSNVNHIFQSTILVIMHNFLLDIELPYFLTEIFTYAARLNICRLFLSIVEIKLVYFSESRSHSKISYVTKIAFVSKIFLLFIWCIFQQFIIQGKLQGI